MKVLTDFAGQNWLITPAALAVGENPPASIHDQKFLLVLSGVVIANLEGNRSEEHTSELQSSCNLVCRLLLAKKETYSPDPATSRARRSRPAGFRHRRRCDIESQRSLVLFFFFNDAGSPGLYPLSLHVVLQP